MDTHHQTEIQSHKEIENDTLHRTLTPDSKPKRDNLNSSSERLHTDINIEEFSNQAQGKDDQIKKIHTNNQFQPTMGRSLGRSTPIWKGSPDLHCP